jgi:cytochrome c oxidase assembly factor CtaG
MLTIAIVLVGCVYLRGWFAIRKTRASQFTLRRLSWFLLGLAVIWVAIASPLDDLADALLSAHMVQHLLLMSVVPPLLLLGWPVVPLLRGLPAWILRPVLGPLLRLAVFRRLGRWLISPPVAWIAMNLTFLGWHVPAAYDFALQHEYWHDFEHVCFLASSLAFWWFVIQPWPTQSRRNSWGLLLYLLSADLVNTALSAFLLPHPAKSFSCLAALRSGSGSGDHVGGWFVRLPCPSDVDYVQLVASAIHAHGVNF